jgi:general secretion pathway protein D
MQPLHRLYPVSRRAALLASACLIVPLVAKEPRGAITAIQRELDQRRIDIQEAEELISQGDLAYQNQRYGDAVTAFSGARGLIPDAPVSRDLRAAATQRLVMASIEQARALARKGDIAKATATMDAVLAPGVAPTDPGAIAMRAKLDDPIRTNPALTAEHVADIDEVRRLLYTADGAYDLGKFDQAQATYQKVLRIDPTNTAARRGMETVAAAKSKYAKAATDHTRAEMLSQVDASWEMPLAPLHLDVDAIDPADPGMADSPMIPVANKLDRIIIPSLILDDASLEEAVELLRLRSSEFDLLETDPARRGVNFNVQIGGPESPIGTTIRAARFSLRLNNVPLSQALRYITDQTRTIYTTDEYAVIIRPLGAEGNEMTTRTFRVPPDFISSLSTEGNAAAPADPFAEKPSGSLLTERRGVREVLGKMGVQFPEGSAVTLNGGSLVITNTGPNMALVEEIVNFVAKTEPVMVCVRVTMIKCQENRLKELGFDWLLGNVGFGGPSWIPGADTLNFSGGTTGTGGNLGDIPLPGGQSSSNPITAGNRSGDEAVHIDGIDAAIARDRTASNSLLGASRAPGVFQVTKLVDDNSVQVMMRALKQKKGVDVVTAASTVTRSGQASSVRSVKEMWYAQAYEPPELPNSVGDNGDNFNNFNNNNNNGRTPFAVTPAHPTDFAKREIGVILEVTPTADADKRFVDVQLAPTVVDFDGYINWGSPINAPVEVPAGGLINPLRARTTEVTPNRIMEPVFSVNRVNTTVGVADGATIVLGGMLQDRITKVNDKTPVFGNIPLIGRLFESDISQPISTAVVFLVNVRLVDPTGQPYSER